jgi:hypothetical protein
MISAALGPIDFKIPKPEVGLAKQVVSSPAFNLPSLSASQV